MNEQLQSGDTDAMGCKGENEKGAASAQNSVQMQFIDPTQRNALFLDVDVDLEGVDKFFDGWKNDPQMATFVQEKGAKCSWCLYPWGLESVSILGTCGHMWHHACLFHWLQKSRRCWCRKYFHTREYEQRGLLNQMPPMDTQENSEAMNHFSLHETEIDNTPIE